MTNNPAETLLPDLAFPNVLVPVGMGAKARLRVIGVNHPQVPEAHRRVKAFHRLGKAGLSVNRVASFETVRRIDADAHRQVLFDPGHDFRHLFKRPSDRRALPRRVFNQNPQPVELQAVRCLPHGINARSDSLRRGAVFGASGMCNQIIRAQCNRPLKLFAEGRNRSFPDVRSPPTPG